jgi:hypothetical protein
MTTTVEARSDRLSSPGLPDQYAITDLQILQLDGCGVLEIFFTGSDANEARCGLDRDIDLGARIWRQRNRRSVDGFNGADLPAHARSGDLPGLLGQGRGKAVRRGIKAHRASSTQKQCNQAEEGGAYSPSIDRWAHPLLIYIATPPETYDLQSFTSRGASR